MFKNENRPLEKISTHYISGHSGEKYRFMTKIPQVMTSALKMNSRILLLRRKKQNLFQVYSQLTYQLKNRGVRKNPFLDIELQLNCKEEVELSHSAVQALQVVVSQQPQCQQPCMLMHSGGFFSFSCPFIKNFVPLIFLLYFNFIQCLFIFSGKENFSINMY